MATSGYVDAYVTEWDTLRFNWWQVSQSISGNYTEVGWNLQLRAGQYGQIISSPSKSWSINVNGTSKSGTATVGINNNEVRSLANSDDYGTIIVYHNNDGSKQFSFSFSQAFDISFNGWVGTVNGSGTGTLDNIPRAASLTAAPEFNDETNPTIYYSNPAGSAVTLMACISLTGYNDDIAYRTISSTAGSYTFNLTSAEKTILYNNTTGSNWRNVYFCLCTSVGGTYYYSKVVRKFTIVNGNPVFQSGYPKVIDTGSVSTALTDDENVIIKNFNYVKATCAASGSKGATISKITVTCGGVTKTISDGADSVYFSNVRSGEFTFTAIDNRGNTVSSKVTKTTTDYSPLTCNTSVEKGLSGVNTGKAFITVNIFGHYSDVQFSSIGFHNALKIKYKTKKNDGEWSTLWTSFTSDEITKNEDGSYSTKIELTNIDYKDTYTFKIQASDKVYTESSGGVEITEGPIDIIPVFDWSKNDFNFNVPTFREGDPIPCYPVGSLFLSDTSFNINEKFGGEWEAVRNFRGGELIAYGTIWNPNSSSVKFLSSTKYGVSDIYASNIASSIKNYGPATVLSVDSGAIRINPYTVGLIEVNVEITGAIGGSCNGIWFHRENKSALPDGVTIVGGNTLKSVNGTYGGASTRYFYEIDSSTIGTAASFYVNPKWSPYNGDFYPCNAGTSTVVQVKAFAKREGSMIYKRIS